MDGFKRAGGLVDKSRFKRRPRYTVVLHDVREKLGLSLNTYVVIDSIHKLSTSDPKYPYCIMSKPNMAEFLQLGAGTGVRGSGGASAGGAAGSSRLRGRPRRR